MARLRLFALLLPILLVGSLAFAQGNPTSTLTGTVTEAGGQPLPGVTVTVKSPSLQGSRSTVSRANGDYYIPALPPGDYTVVFEISGFKAMTEQARLSAAQTTVTDMKMQMANVAAEITVAAQKETISQVQQAATTISAATIDKLPVPRNIVSTVNLAPGANASGPNQGGNQAAIVISGGMSFENLFLINGVVVNENIRGQPLDLFIEDAVQETTTTVAGISAEYGRFGGGVVNVITKSGGNLLSGSFRTTFNNDTWHQKTDYVNPATGTNPEVLLNKNIPTYEATLGGPFWKDRVWFFGAFRTVEDIRNRVTSAPVNAIYQAGPDQQRYEGKLTLSITPKHQILGNYQKINQVDNGNAFLPIYDTDSVINRETPQQIYSANYTGTLTDSFFVEAQYSKREFTFVGSGSLFTDLIKGTLLIDNSNASTRYHSPTFCGVCDDEKRDNRDILVKASYFISTKSLGSHQIVLGYDNFNDQRFANNHQSGSDYRILGTGVIVRDGVVYPRWTTTATGNSPTVIQWNPILQSSQGTEFITHSVFLNDVWRVSNRMTVNLGLRWDKNDGTDAGGAKVIDDSKLSPRLGATYDIFGNGDTIVTGSFARYVSGVANNQADAASIGGQPAQLQFDYRGPQINPDATAPTSSLLTSEQALQILFDWFNANGGTTRAFRGTPSIPGVNPNIDSNLNSPHTNEFSLGVVKRVGSKGLVRLDGIHRKFHDFYATRTDAGTGTVTGTIPNTTISRTLDKQLVVNTETAERQYWGMNFSWAYQVFKPLRLEGNWTWSHAYGNFDGETGPNGPIRIDTLFYPEYHDNAWFAPSGDLGVDRRHKVRAWLVYDIPSPWRFLNGSLGLLHSFDTGAPYGAIGTGAASGVDTRPYVTGAPAYLTPPTTQTYYFTGRDAFRLESAHSTDIALNLNIRPGFKDVEFFIAPEVTNVFNNQAVVNLAAVSTTVRDRSTATTYPAFNPFTETPVEGTHWEKGFQTLPNGTRYVTFGNPTGPNAYQTPRTFRVSVGVKF